MELSGKSAIITGGSRGIGMAICKSMAEKGVSVGVNYVRDGSGDEVIELIKKGGGIALDLQADVRDDNDVKSMVGKAIEAFGKIDFLINSAGISDQMVPVVEQDTNAWQKVMDIDLKGTYLCCKEVAKSMIKNNFGRIVNIASIGGLNAFPQRTAYCPSKSAIIMLTKVLAIEWATYNINVNAIAPGYIRTEMVEKMALTGAFDEEKLRNRIPLRRLGHTSEIADVALFLCSNGANYITGETITVDGGFVAYGYL
jgi:NAD(P)-dependent dehydrogenase (short-subunit alcohol dehydrogenase family)